MASTGIEVKTDSVLPDEVGHAYRSIQGTANKISVTNGDGVNGHPTIDVGSDVYRVGGTDVAVADGGTGTSSLPSGILVGAGTSAITALNNTVWTNFTPTVSLEGGTGNTVPQYSTNSGRYRRIGDIVFVDIRLNADGGDEGAGTGELHLSLPVNPSTNHLANQSPVGIWKNGTTISPLYGRIDTSLNKIGLFKFASLTDLQVMTGADQNNTARELRLKFFYEV